jgi:predicted ATP-grasp superfamily ATP-dependent carboligase
MRIGVLEWICGGGLYSLEPTQIPQSLRDEGLAMLRAVADDLVRGGCEVTLSLDRRLLTARQFHEFASRFQVHCEVGFLEDLPTSWWEIAAQVDGLMVIAPEFSHILQNAIERLAPVSKLLLNCQGEFLEASCDKWQTSQRLQAAGVRHPATRLLSQVTEEWIQQNRLASRRWILKPRDGAGCEGIRLVADAALADALADVQLAGTASQMILQPWHPGAAYSRSAIVDSAGRAHWLPLVTQDFAVSDSLEYRGGRVLETVGSCYEDTRSAKRFEIRLLDEVLNATVQALGAGARGWIGVDLLYCEAGNEWVVVEVNPRLTTSFTGLSMARGSGLMEQVVRACSGREVALGSIERSLAFNAAGEQIM